MPRSYKPFVSCRVSEIQSNSNPADKITLNYPLSYDKTETVYPWYVVRQNNNSLPIVVGQNNNSLPIMVEPIEAQNIIRLYPLW